MSREVWITGIGALTSLGLSMEESWGRLLRAERGTRPLEGDPAAQAVGCAAGAQVEGFKPARYIQNRKSLKLMTRPVALGVTAAGFAFEGAGLKLEQCDPERLGIFVGAGQAFAERDEIQPAMELARDGDRLDLVRFGREGLPQIHPLWLLRGLSNNVLGFVSLDYNAQGINNNYANSGVSGAQAIMGAMEAIADDLVDLSFAGSYDSALAPECLLGYGRLGMLADGALPADAAHRPFDRARCGFVPGEGACFLMLEADAHARARGAAPIARVRSAAIAVDGLSIADPDPEGGGLRRAIAQALKDAHLTPDDIGAIFAHGASSPEYDLIEARVYRDLLGERAAQVPITADKAGFGHTLAASSALGAAVAAMALRDQRLPPISTLERLDPDCAGLRYVTGAALEHDFQHALVCSAGIGGQAAALILSRA